MNTVEFLVVIYAGAFWMLGVALIALFIDVKCSKGRLTWWLIKLILEEKC